MQTQHDDPLAKLRSLLPRAGQLKQAENTGEALKKLTSRLERNESHIANFEAACTGFAVLLVPGSQQSKNVLTDLRHIAPIGADLAKAETLQELEEAEGNLTDDIQKLTEFNRQFHEQARSRIDAVVAPLREVAVILEMLDDPATTNIRNFIARAEVLRQQPIVELTNSLASLLEDGARLTSALPDFGEQEEVKCFLDALRARRATLDLLTPSVLSWLADRKALGRFAISAWRG